MDAWYRAGEWSQQSHCNPASLEHGPYASQRSSVMICQGPSPQPTTYTSHPGSQEAMAHYLNTESLFDDRIDTELWKDRPAEVAVMQGHAERARYMQAPLAPSRMAVRPTAPERPWVF